MEMDAEEDPDLVVIRDPYLLDTAAAGAFIHGLEDEFMDVRTATIGKVFYFGPTFCVLVVHELISDQIPFANCPKIAKNSR